MSVESLSEWESWVIGTTVVEDLLWLIVSFFFTSDIFELNMLLLVDVCVVFKEIKKKEIVSWFPYGNLEWDD